MGEKENQTSTSKPKNDNKNIKDENMSEKNENFPVIEDLGDV